MRVTGVTDIVEGGATRSRFGVDAAQVVIVAAPVQSHASAGETQSACCVA
jgi:hypothetical protein